MSRALSGVVVAALSAAFVSAQSADATWPPPGVVTQITPGVVGPQPITQVQPQYTADAMRRRLQGVVTVACVIFSSPSWPRSLVPACGTSRRSKGAT